MQFYRRIAQIKAISFDLDDTLYNNYPIIRKADAALWRHLQQTYPLTTTLSTQDWLGLRNLLLFQCPELKSDISQLRKLTLRAGLAQVGYQNQQLKNAVADCYTLFYQQRSDFTLAADVIATLEYLAKKMPLVAITNGNVDLQQTDMQRFFVACYKANLHQPRKPHPCMFKKTAQSLSIPPKHILHVGDHLRNDIFGARQSGFATAWYAKNRPLTLNPEPVTLLPDIQLSSLTELTSLVP